MARLPRLTIPGLAHHVMQRGHDGEPLVRDAIDQRELLEALRDAARVFDVRLHAYAIAGAELHLLATPAAADGLGAMVQALGRRYAARFNRRHGRSGALWAGRFRAAPIEPGARTLAALRWIDQAGQRALAADAPASCGSASHRSGGAADPALVDPPEYWALGNTPFEREARYAALLAEPLPAAEAQSLLDAVRGGWVWSAAAFRATLQQQTPRRLSPRKAGRPRR